MPERCNLNISVVSRWWEDQLGVAADAPADSKRAKLAEALPGLITFRAEEIPAMPPDPNHGLTIARALGATLTPTSTGGWDVTPMSTEALRALMPPDYTTDPAVDALRRTLLQAPVGERRAETSGAGVLRYLLLLRGQELFYDFSEEPELVHHMAGVVAETIIRHLVFMKDLCGDITYFVLGNCSNCMISPDVYDEFIRPHESRISTLSGYLKGRPRAMGIHHCGTKVDPYLETYAKIADLEMIEADWTSDWDRTERMMPGILLKPMLDPILLDDMAEEAIAAQVRTLAQRPAVVEIQAFGLSQFFTLAKMRTLLTTVLEENRAAGLPGYTRFFL
ncbi:MAG TPA: uroporphyrinogen decarboxylase family protein [Armatimonadota bacterium]|jgi:hypothetical protein